MDYTCGLDKIYTREEIGKAKASPSFEREYNLKYLGKVDFHVYWLYVQNGLKQYPFLHFSENP
jgi:hypothetical protein